MARPKDEDKRNAILDSATRLVATEGLSVPTSRIAQEAGVSSGTLFLYFATKGELFNQLYLELKEATVAALRGETVVSDDRRLVLRSLWDRTLDWALANPTKRVALTRLMVAPDITPETHERGLEIMVEFEATMKRCYTNGKLSNAPVKLVGLLMNAVIEATVEFIRNHPAEAQLHRQTSFEALWGMVS